MNGDGESESAKTLLKVFGAKKSEERGERREKREMEICIFSISGEFRDCRLINAIIIQIACVRRFCA